MQRDFPARSSATDDASLAVLAAGGDDEAFAALMERTVPMIKRFAAQYRHVYGIGQDDLVQEGLLGLLSAARAYRAGAGDFSAFAAACIRNRMLSALRRQLPADSFELSDAEEKLCAVPSGQAGPEQLVVQKEQRARLKAQLLQELTPLEYRVLMGYLSGQSYAEIASAAEVSKKAVDNALRRVRQKLSNGSFHWFSLWQ